MRIVESEIVGLVPGSALVSGDVEYLRLAAFEPEKQILERLVAATEGE
jgi:glutamate formiminotransferase